MATATGETEWVNRAAFLTPITKVFGTEIGVNISYLGVQIHGGMGFIEETGAAQFSRDVRVTAIYEGTNGIQAMDLVGRKMMDNGETAYAISCITNFNWEIISEFSIIRVFNIEWH